MQCGDIIVVELVDFGVLVFFDPCSLTRGNNVFVRDNHWLQPKAAVIMVNSLVTLSTAFQSLGEIVRAKMPLQTCFCDSWDRDSQMKKSKLLLVFESTRIRCSGLWMHRRNQEI